jgi:DNA (cytosine-5)-methyltransferase 1
VTAFYNEHDPVAAAWLRELIREGHIAPGVVDDRDIQALKGDDLVGFTQVHLFAGVGGWSLALRLAGWSDDRPVWTGSCPCQPFSLAGENKGTADPRDLWPVFFGLACERRPDTIFGEQVTNAIRWGWLDRLCDDLEAEGYACGSTVLRASGSGAHHERSRLYWVASRADSSGVRPQGERQTQEEPWSRKQFEGLVQAAVRASVPSGKSGGLSDGVPARLVRLRGYGNAIVPQVAAAFVTAYLEAREGVPA